MLQQTPEARFRGFSLSRLFSAYFLLISPVYTARKRSTGVTCMTHFLKTDEHPEGYRLEDILKIIRKDIFLRTTKIMDDDRIEAQTVVNNNVQILGLLNEAIAKAEDSTTVLQKSFGPSREGEPRIGV
tara:strand:+ start:4544 stop:4927 length:384 start_codon:yes stop_codon:yes gene_type:complete